MARYAMVHTASGIVVNVIEWSGNEADWKAPAEYSMVEDISVQAGPGHTYDSGAFTAPPSGEQPVIEGASVEAAASAPKAPAKKK